MAEIRAKLQAQETAAADGNKGNFNNEPNAFLAHWNIPDGQPLNLRFLPDGNPDNDYFWKERDMINLWFNGIKGGEQKKVKVVVPCNEMWGPVNSCPVLKEVREWYKAKDPQLEEMARSYWKKKSYLFQCFIGPSSCAVDGDVAPENPIRRVLLNKPIFNKVKSILLNPQIEYLPTDSGHGRDFSILKGKNGGGFAEYDQSQWNFMERPLDAAEQAAIDTHGLFDLNEFMPKQPNEAELQAIAEMFEAAVNGEQYDPERWAFAYRPAGVQKPQGGAPAAPQTQAPAQSAPVTQAAHTPAPVTTPAQVAAPVQQESAPAAAGSAMAALAALQGANGGTAAAAAPQTLTESAPAAPTAKTSSTNDLLAQLQNRK